MRSRILSGLIGLAIFLALCFGGLAPFALGVVVLTALAAYEVATAYRRAQTLDATGAPGNATGAEAQPGVGHWLNPLLAGAAVVMPLAAWRLAQTASPLTFLFAIERAAWVGLFALLLWRAARTGRTLGRGRAVYGLFAFWYLGEFSALVLLRGLPGRITVAGFGTEDRGAWLLLFVAVCVWATDTCAYFVGRSLGRHKLAPSLSPNKTMEGALGGLTGAIGVGAAFGSWLGLPLWAGLAVGAIAGIAGQLGDLFESALKREIGVKDFGRAMPGHGGALDRFDSLLFVAPLAYLLLRLAGAG